LKILKTSGRLDPSLAKAGSGQALPEVFITKEIKMLKKTLLFAIGLLATAASYVMPIKATAQTTGQYEVRKMAVVDRNNDDKPDIVFVGHDKNAKYLSDTNLMYLENQGNGTFSGPKVFEQQMDQPCNLFKGDITGDQLEDLIVIEKGTGSNNGGIYFMPNENGKFGTPILLPTHLQNKEIWAGAVADVNGDGRDDLVGIQNPRNDFGTPSRILWAENLTNPNEYRGAGVPQYRGAVAEFSGWKELGIENGSNGTNYEIGFANYGQNESDEALLLNLKLGRGRYTIDDRRTFIISYKATTGFEEPYAVLRFDRGAIEAFGFIEDMDIETLSPGKQGIFCLFRQDMGVDGTSDNDAIYFAQKNESKGSNAPKQQEPLLTEEPKKIY